MKSILLLVCGVFLFITAFARHGKGGSLSYEYLGNGTGLNSSKYRITVKHYIDCEGTQFIEPASYVGIFNAGNNALVKTIPISESNRVRIQKSDFNPCINRPPTVCYVIVTYIKETELLDNAEGYTLAEQECCRIAGIINFQNSSNYGITNSNTIPGVISGMDYRKNSSPVFAHKDTVVICHNAYFSLDFSAMDVDGDKLTYAFSPAKSGGTMQVRQPNPPATPPYIDIPYQLGYSALQPLGTGVTIDATTGIISGKAPATLGSYIISVTVSESRNGFLIGLSKKEVQVTVTDCTLSAATLKPYNSCEDFTFNFKNESLSANVSRYSWNFGVLNALSDTSSVASPTFTYADTGRYILKLKVSSVAGCEDSATAEVLVYPGFKSAFKATGSCFQSPFLFTDLTTANYGTVNSWTWNFGDDYSTLNATVIKNPSHAYTNTGTYSVSLVSGSSKGCVDTAYGKVLVSDKPFLSLPFRDTLICSIDTLMLQAKGSGVFTWMGSNMLNAATDSPFVFPKNTTQYIVTLNVKGCIAKDSVTVNVLDRITLTLPSDTTICKADSFQLRPISEGLQYQWLPRIRPGQCIY